MMDNGISGINFALLIGQIKKHEGFRKNIYMDTTGHKTIGYGTNLERGITEKQAEHLLIDDLEIIIASLNKFGWYMDLDSVRKCVIINMSYNMGVMGVLGFKKMIAALIKKNWVEAADCMLDSLWANQVNNRVGELAEIMLTGIFPGIV